MAAIRKEKWYRPWMSMVAKSLEQCFDWGATNIILAGIKGNIGANYATMNEWPALIADLQAAFGQGRIHGSWSAIEECRIDIDRLSAKIKEASGNIFLVVASSPHQHFEAVKVACKGNRNVLLAYGRVDDVSGLIVDMNGLAMGEATPALSSKAHGVTEAAAPPGSASGGAAPPAGLLPGQRHLTEAQILEHYNQVEAKRRHESEDPANGWATFTWEDGDRYVGEWKNRKQHGQGMYKFSNGEKYVGLFKDGSRHGEGTVTFPNGEKYVGQYLKSNPDGEGTYTYANGEKYEGQFFGGLKSGRGKYTYKNRDTYEGEYRKDKQHGTGTYTFANGDKWVGGYIEGKQHGKGVYTFASNGKTVQEVYNNGVKQ